MSDGAKTRDQLVAELNAMSRKIGELEGQLRLATDPHAHWRSELERRVKERTGELLQANSQLQDEIRERKQAEDALRDSEQRLELALHGADLGLWDWYVQTGRGVVNRRSAEIIGYALDEIVQSFEFWVTLLHPEDRIQAVQAVYAHLEGRTAYYEDEYRVKAKSGEWKCIFSRGKVVERDRCGKPLRMAGTFQDITSQKQTEEALRRSEERYRTVADFNYDWEYWIAPDNKLLYVSPSCERITGYSAQEFLADPGLLERIVHPDDLDDVLQHFRKARGLDHESLYSIDFRILHRNGQTLWINHVCRPVCREDGNPLGRRASNRDITDRKRAEEAVSRSERLLNDIIEQSPFSMWISDASGTMISLNEACRKTMRTRDDEVVGKYNILADSIVEEQGLMPLVQSVFERGATAHFEIEYDSSKLSLLELRKTVSLIFDVTIFPVLGPGGKPANIVVQYIDITERRRAEASLRESEERFRLAMEAASDGIWDWEVPTGRTYYSPAYFRMLGYEPDDFQTHCEAGLDWIHPEDREKVLRVRADCIEGRCEAFETELRMRDKTGAWRWILGRGRSIARDENGRSVRIIGTHVDISMLKRAEGERALLRDQLRQSQKMEAIGTLAGGIAHDFNNILQVTLGYSELLLTRKIEKNRDYDNLQKIRHAARSGADLVRSLLTFSRKVESKPVPMDLNNHVRNVEKLLYRTIPRMIDIRLELANDLKRISADPGQIEQIIVNLAVNARDAMGEKGSLTIKTEDVVLDEEYCRLNVEAKPGDYVLLSVSDTGCGMDWETLQHILEPFYTTKELGRGTGLGLAIVYGIVKQHKGHLTCHSELGKGTTFRVYLPAILSEPENVADSGAEIPAFGTETLLLVDDEDFVRCLGEEILTASGYTVLIAADGQEALRVYAEKREQISLVVLDLIMPSMGGKDCLRELLKIDPTGKVLIASGHAADETMRQCMRLGAKAFVAKPFRLKDLLQQVRKTLDET